MCRSIFPFRDDYNVIELGSGVGLPALLLAKTALTKTATGIKNPSVSIVMTDCDEDVLRNLRESIQTNFPSSSSAFNEENKAFDSNIAVSVQPLNWLDYKNCDSFESNHAPTSSFLVGSALCYLPQHSCVADVIEFCMEQRRVQKAFLCQIRDRDGLQQFLSRLDELQLPYTIEPVPRELYEKTMSGIFCSPMSSVNGQWERGEGEKKMREAWDYSQAWGEEGSVKVRKRYYAHLPTLLVETPSSPPPPPPVPPGLREHTSCQRNLLRTPREDFVFITVSRRESFKST